jgi:transcription initiation factor IIE alpha subunit
MGKKAPGIPGRRRGFSKIKDEALYELVKAKIVEYASKGHWYPVRAEWYANEFKVPIHKITQVFMRLNHEGLMSRRHNHKSDFAWNSSYYYVKSKKPAGQPDSAVRSTA